MSGRKHYVIGDLHAAVNTLKNIIKEANIDPEEDFVYFVGDYVKGLGAEPGDEDKKLFEYLNKHYEKDITKPGFHLIRGNHEWMRRKDGRGLLYKRFGNIEIFKLPDIIRVPIKPYEFVIAHSGMSKAVYDFMKEKNSLHVQLDTNWMYHKVGRDYYDRIIWTKKMGSTPMREMLMLWMMVIRYM